MAENGKMSMCPNGRKKWVRPTHKGNDHIKRKKGGHSWKRLTNNTGLRIGRECVNCHKREMVTTPITLERCVYAR